MIILSIMAPSKKSFLEGFGSLAKKIKGYSSKAKKAIDIGKRAKGVYESVKSAAGESACANKKCTTKEKIMDYAQRAFKGGKAFVGQKENIRDIYESGKRLAKVSSGKMSEKPQMMKKEKPMVPERSSKPTIPMKKPAYSKPSGPPVVKPKPSMSKPSMVPKAPPAPAQKMSMPAMKGDLLSEIRAGKQLKKTVPNQKSSSGDLQDLLRKKMAERFGSMNR